MVDGQFKIGAIIQARLGSIRLPNKVFMPIGEAGRTIISQVIFQLKRLEIIDKVVVATSVSKINDSLEKYVKELNIDCYRGDEDDVLSRFSNVIESNNFDYVLRFTSDNPVVDLHYLEKFIKNGITKQLDYSCSKNLPLGCNFEMIRSSLLLEANIKSINIYDKEHVTPFIKRSAIKKEFFDFEKKDIYNKLRLTIDYPTDYSFIYLVSHMLKGKELNIENIETLIKNNSWLLSINETNFQKKEYKNIKEEILDILPTIRAREMKRIEKKLINEI